jgi:hypothetical protein
MDDISEHIQLFCDLFYDVRADVFVGTFVPESGFSEQMDYPHVQ